jgi:hypothetical protein
VYDFGLARHPTVYDFVRSPRGRVRFWPCQPPVVYKNGRKLYTAGPLEGKNRTRQPSPVQLRAQIPHRQDRCPTFSQLGGAVAATPFFRSRQSRTNLAKTCRYASSASTFCGGPTSTQTSYRCTWHPLPEHKSTKSFSHHPSGIFRYMLNLTRARQEKGSPCPTRAGRSAFTSAPPATG